MRLTLGNCIAPTVLMLLLVFSKAVIVSPLTVQHTRLEEAGKTLDDLNPNRVGLMLRSLLPTLIDNMEDIPPLHKIDESLRNFNEWIDSFDFKLPSPIFDTVKVPLFDLEGSSSDIMKRHLETLLRISPVIIYATFVFGPAPFILLFYVLRFLIGLGADLFAL